MIPILTAAEMRAAEDRAIAAGTSVEVLMERAGRAVAEAVLRIGAGAETLILCGPGNNGGDGYVVARLLAERGIPVRVAASAEPTTEAASAARAGWSGPVAALAEAEPAPILVDALFGTGLARPLAGDVVAALARLAAGARRRIAVDLPSGIASDDGAILSAIPCYDATVALGAPKPAHLLQPAARHMGTLLVADIGVAVESRTGRIGRPSLAAPGPDDHKYSRGMVAVVAGAMPGAAALAAEAAARAGAGYVLLAGEAVAGGGPAAIVRRSVSLTQSYPLLADKRVGAIVVGPGLGEGDRARAEAAFASGRPLVIDAGAIAMARGQSFAAAVLTPHEGEFVRVFGDLPGSKLDRARAAAGYAGAVVLLKGADSVVAAPDGRAAIAPPAPAWLATAGTGDVLAGIVAAMLARSLDPFDAACAALWLHGRAGETAGAALIADDLLAALPGLVGACAG